MRSLGETRHAWSWYPTRVSEDPHLKSAMTPHSALREVSLVSVGVCNGANASVSARFLSFGCQLPRVIRSCQHVISDVCTTLVRAQTNVFLAMFPLEVTPAIDGFGEYLELGTWRCVAAFPARASSAAHAAQARTLDHGRTEVVLRPYRFALFTQRTLS